MIHQVVWLVEHHPYWKLCFNNKELAIQYKENYIKIHEQHTKKPFDGFVSVCGMIVWTENDDLDTI